MDLKEYLFRYEVKQKDLMEEVKTSTLTISNVKLKKTSPGLILAARIVKATNGVVSFEDLLSKKDSEELMFWEKEFEDKKKATKLSSGR